MAVIALSLIGGLIILAVVLTIMYLRDTVKELREKVLWYQEHQKAREGDYNRGLQAEIALKKANERLQVVRLLGDCMLAAHFPSHIKHEYPPVSQVLEEVKQLAVELASQEGLKVQYWQRQEPPTTMLKVADKSEEETVKYLGDVEQEAS